jgi:hypothetical protein
MPLYVDVYHHADGLTADAVKGAHEADVATQDEFGVRYLQYWFDEGSGKLFCLVEVPMRRWPRRSIAVRMAWWPMRLWRSSRAHEWWVGPPREPSRDRPRGPRENFCGRTWRTRERL